MLYQTLFFLSLMMALFIHIECYKSFQKYADFTTDPDSIIKSTTISNNGKTGYITMINPNNKTVIRKYNLTVNPINLLGEYESAPNNLPTNQHFVFRGYMIAYQSNTTQYNIYNQSTFSYLSQNYINGSIIKFDDVKSKESIIFTTAQGNVGYVNRSIFPFQNESQVTYFENPYKSHDTLGYLSASQNYYSLVSSNSANIVIISLNNMSVIYSYETSGGYIETGTWDAYMDVFYASSSNNTLYKINMKNLDNLSTQVISYLNGQYYYVRKIEYLQDMMGIVGVSELESDDANNSSRIKLLGYHPGSGTLTENDVVLSEGEQIVQYGFDEIDSAYFYVQSENAVYFYEINSCQSGYFFDRVQQACSLCTSGCSNCSKLGCEAILDFTTSSNSSNRPYMQKRFSNFKSFMNSTFNHFSLQTANLLPGGRKFIAPFCSFFANFDDFQLYNYHFRSYDSVIQTSLDFIKQIEGQKWELLTYKNIFKFLGLDDNNYENFFSIKKGRSSPRFVAIESKSNGFFPNTPNFLFSNIFVTFGFFLGLKLLFRILQKYQISRFLKEYAFWPTLFLITMQGNLQYITYLITFDILTPYGTNFEYKLIDISIIIIFFFLLLFGGFIFYILRSHYGKHSKHFLGYVRNTFHGVVYLSSYAGLRNIMLGITHYTAQKNYESKIYMLLSFEVVFLCGHMIAFKANKGKSLFYIKRKVWFCYILPGLIRLFLVYTFFLTYSNDDSDHNIDNVIYQSIHLTLVYCYIAMFALVILSEVSGILWEIVKYMIAQKAKAVKTQRNSAITCSTETTSKKENSIKRYSLIQVEELTKTTQQSQISFRAVENEKNLFKQC